MIKPKYTFLIFVFVGALAISMLMSGCKKCYTCYTYCVEYATGAYANTICGSKTSSAHLIDSLVSAGDTILAVGWGAIYNTGNSSNQKFCGKSELDDAKASGDSCVEGYVP